MSFAIYVTAYSAGEVALFDRTVVMAAFRPFITGRGVEGWELVTPSGPSLGVIGMSDDPKVGGFLIRRPPLIPPNAVMLWPKRTARITRSWQSPAMNP